MATIFRKVWESVSNRAISCSSSILNSENRIPSCTESASLGDFDRLPIDITMQILKLVEPKEAAKLSVVSKSWRSVVSDNRLWIFFIQNYHDLWDSIFFSETQLRSGYPIQRYTALTPTELSFMRIYGQREKVPGSVIIDGGSGYCKFGWSKYACPSGRSATFLEFGNIESPMCSRLRHFFATVCSRMQVRPYAQPIVVSLPICHYDDTESAKASRRQLKEAIYAALFDMNAPAVCAINQATLALYAAQRTSGIAVNIGFQVTSIVPILHGKVMRKVGVEVIGVGALKVTGFLREQMQQNNINFESLYTVRTLKENLCYVAADYEAELSKDTRASLEILGEGWFTLSKERFKTGEILFQPRIAGMRAMGLHQAVALCMDHCHAAELTADDSWYKTVVLSGGTACLPGLAGNVIKLVNGNCASTRRMKLFSLFLSERLEKELHGLLPESISSGIRVIPPPYGADTAWFGAKLISNLSTFPGPWCVTKKQFRRKPRLNLAW